MSQDPVDDVLILNASDDFDVPATASNIIWAKKSSAHTETEINSAEKKTSDFMLELPRRNSLQNIRSVNGVSRLTGRSASACGA